MIEHAYRSGLTLQPPAPVRLLGYAGLALLIAGPILASVVTLPRVIEAPSFVLPIGYDHHLSSPADGVVQRIDLEEGARIDPGQIAGVVQFQAQDEAERRERDALYRALDRAIGRARTTLEKQHELLEATGTAASDEVLDLLAREMEDRRKEVALRKSAEARARLGAERGAISADLLDERTIERVVAERELKSAERELVQGRRQAADDAQRTAQSIAEIAAAQVELLGQLTRSRQEQAALKQANIRYERDEPRVIAEWLVHEGDWVKRGDVVARTVVQGPSGRLVVLLDPADASAVAEGMYVEVEFAGRDGRPRDRSTGVVTRRGGAWTKDGHFDRPLEEDTRVSQRIFVELLDGKTFPVGTRAKVLLRLEDTSVLRALLFGGTPSS